MRSLLRLCAWLLALSASGCAALAPAGDANALHAELTGSLPTLGGLDALRAGAAVELEALDVLAPLATANTAPAGPALDFDSPAFNLAWAIYRIAPSGPPLSISAQGGGQIWIVLADYAANRWVQPAPLADGSAQGDFTQLGGWESPGGYAYCAVVCPQAQSGRLDSLTFNYSAPGVVRYVAPPADGGSDANPGTSELPWATLQHAADSVEPDSQVVVRPGAYAGFMLQTSGAPDGPVIFSAQPGVEIVADNPNTPDGINIENWDGGGISWVVIEGFTSSNRTRCGIRVAGSEESFAHHITIRDCTCDSNGMWGILFGHTDYLTVEGNSCSNSAGEHGIYLSNSGDYNIARGNQVFDNNFSGIQFNADASLGGDGLMSFALIENNVCSGNGPGGAALNMDGLADSVIRNNLLYGNHSTGLVMYSGDGGPATGNIAVHNTIVMAQDGRWCVTIGNGSTGNRLEHNILLTYHSFRGALDIDSSSLPGFSSDRNVVCDRFELDGGGVLTLEAWRAQTGQDLHSVVAAPDSVFAAPGSDWRLRPGSPALELAALPHMPPLDIAGVLRPQGPAPDAGCYELPAE